MMVLSWSLATVIGFLVSARSGSAVDTGDARIRGGRANALAPLLEEGGEDRRLVPCPDGDYCAIISEPRLSFCTKADFTSDKCEELGHFVYPSTDFVCETSEPTVIVLAGLQNCVSSIRSVAFNLTRVGKTGSLRYFVEKVYPYTVFGDNATSVTARNLIRGTTYKLEVTIKEKDGGCVSLFESYNFYVDQCV